MGLLNELGAEDLIVLCKHTLHYRKVEGWLERNRDVLETKFVALSSSQQEKDAGTLRQMRDARLVRLGVLEKVEREGRLSPTVQLSDVGHLVLRRIGLLKDGEF